MRKWILIPAIALAGCGSSLTHAEFINHAFALCKSKNWQVVNMVWHPNSSSGSVGCGNGKVYRVH